MRRSRLTALSLLCCATLCACADDQKGALPELRLVRPAVPAALLSCAEAPADVSAKPGLTQRDVARYVVELRAAGDDCRAKLGEVRSLVQRRSDDH